jgi:hypothetical protein
MWVDDRARGTGAKMYRGRVQGSEFIQSRRRREKVDTRQSRWMSLPRCGRKSGIVTVVKRGGEEDQADDDIA